MKRNVNIVCTACGSGTTGWVDDTEQQRPIHVSEWECTCIKRSAEALNAGAQS